MAASGSSATSRKSATIIFPLPAQWDVTHKIWRKYFVPNGADWWVPFYPADNAQRPTGPLCDGCHSVNYDIATKTVTEWNVGCERCHGPGSEHIAKPVRETIVNPARLDYVHANDTCIQCHSQGQPLKNPIDGKYYDWPVGFHMGLSLNDFWKLEDHKLGETTFTHFADGTAHKNRMQGNDFVDQPDVHARRHLLQLPRSARLGERCHAAATRQHHMPGLPRAELAEWPARRNDRTTYASRRGQHGQSMCRLPYAEDRADDRRRERQQPHLPLRLSGPDRQPENPERVQCLPHGQIDGMGSRRLMRWKDRSPWRIAN